MPKDIIPELLLFISGGSICFAGCILLIAKRKKNITGSMDTSSGIVHLRYDRIRRCSNMSCRCLCNRIIDRILEL